MSPYPHAPQPKPRPRRPWPTILLLAVLTLTLQTRTAADLRLLARLTDDPETRAANNHRRPTGQAWNTFQPAPQPLTQD